MKTQAFLPLGLLCAALATAQTPSAPLPSAPATPPPSLQLPPVHYDRPTGLAPLHNANDFCFAPAEDVYRKQNTNFPPDLRGLMRSYIHNVYSQIFSDWRQHMSLSEKNAWGKGRYTALRFAIRPDGSLFPTEVTHSSGNTRYDAHALSAINRGGFPPLPTGITHSVPVCIIVGFHLEDQQLPPEAHGDWTKDLR